MSWPSSVFFSVGDRSVAFGSLKLWTDDGSFLASIEFIKHVMPFFGQQICRPGLWQRNGSGVCGWSISKQLSPGQTYTKVRVQRIAGCVETHWRLASVKMYESYSCDLPLA